MRRVWIQMERTIMSAKRMVTHSGQKPSRWGHVSLVLAASLLMTATGCRQQAKPPVAVPESQPTATAQPQTMPVEESPATQEVAQTQPAERPRHFEVTELGEIKPDRKLSADQPLAILSKSNGQKQSRLRAVLKSDTLLVIDTENVQALRLDLLNLPREQGGRLVLHIDGQGIEITGKKNQIIYLQRSSVGEWSFGRPANVPSAPPR